MHLWSVADRETEFQDHRALKFFESSRAPGRDAMDWPQGIGCMRPLIVSPGEPGFHPHGPSAAAARLLGLLHRAGLSRVTGVFLIGPGAGKGTFADDACHALERSGGRAGSDAVMRSLSPSHASHRERLAFVSRTA